MRWSRTSRRLSENGDARIATLVLSGYFRVIEPGQKATTPVL
jgi:hypothetical protein